VPEYIEEDGNIRFSHESIVERPVVQNGEPLQKELDSFVHAIKTKSAPEVTVEDGLDALSVALEIERKIGSKPVATPSND